MKNDWAWIILGTLALVTVSTRANVSGPYKPPAPPKPPAPKPPTGVKNPQKPPKPTYSQYQRKPSQMPYGGYGYEDYGYDPYAGMYPPPPPQQQAQQAPQAQPALPPPSQEDSDSAAQESAVVAFSTALDVGADLDTAKEKAMDAYEAMGGQNSRFLATIDSWEDS